MQEDSILISFIINLFYQKPVSQGKESIEKEEVKINIKIFMFNSYLSSEKQYNSEQSLLMCSMKKGMGEVYLMNQVCYSNF